ncbi:MAG: S8 family peptidase, partial [Clostridiaceae bacterium]
MFNIDIRQILDINFSLENAIIAIVEFQGDIEAEAAEIPNARVFNLGKNRAILAGTGDFQEVVNKLSHVINFIYPNLVYTLCQVSALEASNADLFHESPYLQLDGEGIIIGIVDSGIDYLNEEFINEDGTSRIIAIFDQTQLQGPPPAGQPVGREYLNDDINKAIQEKRAGKDPYAVVPVKDEIGHGTSMASIAGARGVDATVTGIAPNCSFAIVKLMAAESSLKNDFGVFGNAPVYSTPALYLGIKYLFDLASKLKTPIVILVPLGSGVGSKTGQSILESYIDEISGVRGITAVVPTGNQGNTETHTSGILSHVNDVSDIELKIDRIQRDIRFEIWVSKPNKSSLSIISPTGETYDRILLKDNVVTEINFLYEGTKFYVLYNLSYVKTGDERILITARNIREGIWIFRLTLEYGENARYDAYLIQRELLAPETKFLRPDPYITLTVPSTSQLAISVASYNQNNNANVSESGKGYTRTG